jgi:hypothetical protein
MRSAQTREAQIDVRPADGRRSASIHGKFSASRRSASGAPGSCLGPGAIAIHGQRADRGRGGILRSRPDERSGRDPGHCSGRVPAQCWPPRTLLGRAEGWHVVGPNHPSCRRFIRMPTPRCSSRDGASRAPGWLKRGRTAPAFEGGKHAYRMTAQGDRRTPVFATEQVAGHLACLGPGGLAPLEQTELPTSHARHTHRRAPGLRLHRARRPQLGRIGSRCGRAVEHHSGNIRTIEF